MATRPLTRPQPPDSPEEHHEQPTILPVAAMSEPTMGEVVRRLEEIAKQLERTSEDFRRDRAEQARTYVRQDVYVSDKRAEELARGTIARATEELEERLDKAEAFKRQIMAGGAVQVIGLALTLVLALSAFLATKGG